MDEDNGLATYATRLATSSGSIMRWISEDGRALAKNSASSCSAVASGLFDVLLRKSMMPSERVGPGSTAFTVTLVPRVSSARPRETASCAVLVMP